MYHVISFRLFENADIDLVRGHGGRKGNLYLIFKAATQM